jgi:glucokinase
MDRRFVVVSGVPGSGKSFISSRLAPVLGLPLIDKDDILERLFDVKGIGDANWRRRLSRESDILFRDEAERSNGAFLVSFWHLPGMPLESGTPTNWLPALSRRIVNLHCECSTAIAAARLCQRRRHPGHVDHVRSRDEVVATIQSVSELRPLEVGPRVRCDTSFEFDLALLARQVSAAFEEP